MGSPRAAWPVAALISPRIAKLPQRYASHAFILKRLTTDDTQQVLLVCLPGKAFGKNEDALFITTIQKSRILLIMRASDKIAAPVTQ